MTRVHGAEGLSPLSRRGFLRVAGGAAVASVAWPLVAACGGSNGDDERSADRGRVTIMMGGEDGEFVFVPDRLHVEPGTSVRWVVQSSGHSTTAYHPANHDLYEARVPGDAEPWDSGVLAGGETFERTFTVEGVYQYYCIPHEGAGMVGTIVVGAARRGPGTAPVQEEIPEAAQVKLQEQVAWANDRGS